MAAAARDPKTLICTSGTATAGSSSRDDANRGFWVAAKADSLAATRIGFENAS